MCCSKPLTSCPSSVRRTARTLNLPSDASYRFERGVDPGMVLPASQRATELMREIAGGNPAPEIATAGALPAPPADVSLRYERCNELIGVCQCRRNASMQILEGFGLEKTQADENESSWHIPSYPRRSPARSRSDRGSRARLWNRERARAAIAAVSRRNRTPIATTISNPRCGSAWSRAGFPKCALRP